MDRAMSGGSDAATSYVDGLRRILVGYVGHCAAHPAEVLAVRAIRESATSSAVQRAKAADHRVGMAELVAFLKEGQEHGEFRDFDPEVFTSTLFAAMRDVPAQLEGLSQQQGTEFAVHWSAIFIHAAADQHQDEENR